MSYDYDVAIVGAGPVGSTLAYQLVECGLNICLIDKKKKIGLPLQCAGIINRRVKEINDVPDSLILNKVKGANLHNSNHSLTVSKDETQAFIIDRVALDQYLFKRVADKDIDYFLSSKVVDIDSEEGIVSFKKFREDFEIKAKIIVGADGPQSFISSEIGNKTDFYNASQYLVKVDKIEDMDFVGLYAYADLFPGFIWVIPVYSNIFRIGLFSNHDYKQQGKILDNFLNNDFSYDDFEILENYLGKIPKFNKNNKLYSNRVILIGDAACQVKPTTGGGLLLGFEAVKFAKENIINALNNDDYSLLANYERDFYSKFLNEISYQLKVQKTLCTLSNEDLDYLFAKLKEKEIDKLISEYGDMDNQSILIKEFLKRGILFSILPTIHKTELAKIWLSK